MKKFLLLLSFLVLFFPIFSVYANAPVKILIVPGHDNIVFGAEYNNIKEADMTLALGTEIFNLLEKDERFNIQITRNGDGYVPTFNNYFSEEKDQITLFKEKAKQLIKDQILNGIFVKKTSVPHVAVKSHMSNVLYGINKWANENDIDAIIHIHFNDYPRKHSWTKGQYKGFAIYVPEKQMANSQESILLSKSIHDELLKKYFTSNYKKELGGLVQDQSLIALGASGTLNASARSVLVEYGYIYRFGNKEVRNQAYKNMADLTVVGIRNYFFK